MSQQNVNTTASESKESSSLKAKNPRRPVKAKADKAAAAAVEQALEKIEIEMIPLSRLAISPLNVRSRVYVLSRIESLAATIKNVGLLHNLIAHDMADGMLGVACGGRRLTALQLLLSQGVYQPDQLIPVKRVTEELARAASMVENGEREDMHPAEQISGFRALAGEGKTPAQIGDLMGYSSRHVQRCLKLIDLAPAILDELAADNITLEQCQALALADTHDRQLEVWKQASGYYNASAEVIRKLITSSETAISHSPKFAFIGKDAYLAAGGTIRTDLFSSKNEGYIDTALVEQLTLNKLQQIAEAVQKDEGFAWTEVRMDSRLQSWSSEMKKNYQLLPERCPKLTPEEDAELSELRAQLKLSDDDAKVAQLKKQVAALEETGLKRSWAGADKDKVGAMICFEWGSCFIQRGVQRCADLPKKKKAENKGDLQTFSEDYSATLVRSMSCERSLAVQAALSTEPEIALAMLTWTLCRSTFSHRSYDWTPMKISLTDNSSALVAATVAKEETKTGMLFASKLMQDSFTIDSRNPVLAYNMGEYAKNCVVPDIMLNHKYSMQDVMESEDVQAQIFGNRHMDYGYAVTTYSSQGASVKYLIGLFGEEGARKMMAALDSTYVQLSRAKDHVQTYFDNLSGWADRVESKSGRRQTVHDVLMRAEDVRAGREIQAWDKSLPVSGTRLADRVDQDLTADARFMAGKTPEMLWPVINEHGRQRGNWHVPVSPSSGEVNFSAAHYEGAVDGSRIVLQRGEKHGKVLEAADVAEALQLMKENPDSPIVLSADHSERSGDKSAPAEAAAATSDGEELDRREAEVLEKAIKAAQGQEEKEPEPAVQDDARSAPDDRESEREAALAAALEDLQAEEAFDYRDYDLSPEREDSTAMMNDEVNVMRHERSEPEPEFGHKPQKNLE